MENKFETGICGTGVVCLEDVEEEEEDADDDVEVQEVTVLFLHFWCNSCEPAATRGTHGRAGAD